MAVNGNGMKWQNGVLLTRTGKPFWSLEKGSGCWLWLRAKDGSGYGKIHREGKYLMAHRWLYQVLRKIEVPPNMDVHHEVCSNPLCVNPGHMRVVTHYENLLARAQRTSR